MRVAVYLLILLFSASSFAVVEFKKLSWLPDGDLVLVFTSPYTSYFAGRVQLNSDLKGEIESTGGDRVVVKRYVEGFVTLVFFDKHRPGIEIFVLEAKDNYYVAVNSLSIKSPGPNGDFELDSVVRHIAQTRGWDVPISLRTLATYFNINNNKSLPDFMAALERGEITEPLNPAPVLAKAPEPKIQGSLDRQRLRKQAKAEPRPKRRYDRRQRWSPWSQGPFSYGR